MTKTRNSTKNRSERPNKLSGFGGQLIKLSQSLAWRVSTSRSLTLKLV